MKMRRSLCVPLLVPAATPLCWAAMTGNGVAMTGNGVAMTGNGVAMTSNGVAMTGNGVAMMSHYTIG